MIDYVAIGRKIKMYRNKVNLTQSDLAEKLNVSAKYISSIERGVSKISLVRLDEIATILDTNISALLSDCDITKNNYAESELLELTKNWEPHKKDVLINVINALNESM